MAYRILNTKALKQYKPSEFEKSKDGKSYYLKEGVKPKIGTTQYEEPPLKNKNIAKGIPTQTANSSYINAVYWEKKGRAATPKEILHFQEKGASVKEVADTVLGMEKSPFSSLNASTTAEAKTAISTGAGAGDTGAGAGDTGAGAGDTGAGAGDTAGGGGGGGISSSPADGLGEPYKGMYEEAKKLLDSLQAKGQVVAADIVITPEKAAEFMTQAQSEVDPYYATEFDKAKTAFLQTQGYEQADLQKFEQDMERKYGFNQKNVAASAAERGFAQSGIRQQEEGNLAYDTQQALDVNRTNLGRRQQELAQAFAGTYGGKNTPGALNINEASTVGVEGFSKSSKEKPLYQLSPDLYQNLIGSQEYAKTAAEKARAVQLEGAFREGEALKQNRALTI